MISKPRKHIPAPIPDECSIHSPVATSNVVPNKFNELRILHNFRRARKAADSYLGSPVNCDNAPISRIREPESRYKVNQFQESQFWDSIFLNFNSKILLTTPRSACFSCLILHDTILSTEFCSAAESYIPLTNKTSTIASCFLELEK